MIFRKFQHSDRKALISLWENVFPDDPAHNEPSKLIDAKLAVDDLILVAESGDRIIAACLVGYDGHRGWLYAVAVAPELRRGGTGSKLIEYAVLTLKELGCFKVNLQIRSSNVDVAAFYASLGFETEERLSMGRFIK